MNKHINYFEKPYSYRTSPMSDHGFFMANNALSNGTIFEKLYDSYYNYVPQTLVYNNTVEGFEHIIQAYNFALIDLGLYLDLHPNDTAALELFKTYQTALNEAISKYEANIGALTLDCQNLSDDTWQWFKDWPWKGEKA